MCLLSDTRQFKTILCPEVMTNLAKRIHLQEQTLQMISPMNGIQNKSSTEEVNQRLAEQDSELAPGYVLGDDHLQSAAFLAKSLSDGNRLRILVLISNGRKSVSAIVEELELSQPLVSHHLKELKRSLLVKVEREGPFIYYELADARILNVLQTLSDVATDLLSNRKLL